MGFGACLARFTSKKRELMKAVWRLGGAVLAIGLMLAPLPARAQDAATATAPSNTPATDAIGPRDLQNFTLNGTVTRPADPVTVPRSTSRSAAPPRTQPPATASTALAQPAAPGPAPERSVQRAPARIAERPVASQPRPAASSPAPSAAVTTTLPPIDDAPVSTAPATSSLAPPAESLGGDHRLLLWPWLLAAIVLGAGGAFLLWRNHRPGEALAGGPQIDAFVAPDAVPAPPRPAPQAAPLALAPAPAGIVSTRLRPWIDLAFQPGRCIIEDDKVTFEFELAVQNSGNALARGVLVEASLINAGPHQDQEVSAFYGSPVGEGERIPLIPPLKSILVKTKVVGPRANVRLLEIGGRQVFVPLIAFNALYSWASGDGQTSASYLLGRDTRGEKLAPFRLDLGPRIVRSVGARLLPIAVRK